jgi:hypothetical protein
MHAHYRARCNEQAMESALKRCRAVRNGRGLIRFSPTLASKSVEDPRRSYSRIR